MKRKKAILFKQGSVLLFSGGLDSYITAKLFEPNTLLYVDIGSKYAHKELRNLQNLDVHQSSIVVDKRLNLQDAELENSIVPLRNIFLALIGLYYGNEIMLAATKGDTTMDKDETFRELFEQMAHHLITDEKDDKTFPWKKLGILPRLRFPIKSYTKTELIAMYLKKGFKPQGIYNTISCYDPVERECGECKTCFRKAVALINNGIYKAELFSNPIDWKYFLQQTLDKNRPGEAEESIQAMKRIGVI